MTTAPGSASPSPDRGDRSVAEQSLSVEFLVEPFSEGAPGEHVRAAVAAFERRGLRVDLGPFSSVVSGDPEAIAQAVADMILGGMAEGATSMRIHVGPDAKSLSVGPLHDALRSMIRAAERDIGTRVDDWTRADKQRVVRLLEEQGAFLLRGAVDDMARIMGVSRITIYNYLNAIDRSG
jgi:uncharacterized protein YqgV (UPF0045/DUF77 family)